MMSFLDFADDDPKRASRRPLLFFILVTLAVGAAGSVFTEPNIEGWYAGLIHPSFAPPNWLFAPVWTTLYVLMGGGGVASMASQPGPRSPEMGAYVLQLVFNFAWSGIFFAAHQIGLALVELCVLLVLILATTILFWRRDRLAGLLFLPYLAWTSFATALNYAFWSLNP